MRELRSGDHGELFDLRGQGRGGGVPGKPHLNRPAPSASRVLFVMPWDLGPIGGVNAVVANLYEQFRARGALKPCVLVLSWEHVSPVFARERGFDKVRVRVRGPVERGSAARCLAAYVATLPAELLKVRRLVKQLGATVVNAHYPTLAMVTFALARRLGLIESRIVLSFHGTDIRTAAAGGPLVKRLWRWVLRESDAVVAVSRGLANEVAGFEPGVREKTEVVYNGLDPEEFVALAEAPTGLSERLAGRRVILEVGAFERNKGQDLVLKALAPLAAKYPDLHLLLVGQTVKGSSENEVETLIQELGLMGRCTVVKNAPRHVVAECMRLASIFVLPSRAEGFGLVVLEAGAFALPVVATRVGGIPEIISGPEYGMLVEPENEGALRSAIESVLADPEAARKMGQRLQTRVKGAFSWEQAYEKYSRVFA